MSELPSAPFERIMKNVGAHRVGEDAKEKMREIVEEYSIKLATKSSENGRTRWKKDNKGRRRKAR